MYSKTLIFLCTFCCNVLLSLSLPQETIRVNSDVENFQNAVQKQTFNSVLFSIEERLRNLDNIYSMQLSETLKTKLEQYHRKLEILDKKMIQLESMIMLNLDKISENISTKNYRDDIVKTQIYRKLDNMYDGLSHRMSYMDKKHDMALDKLQIKTDTVMSRLEKMEDSMNQKYSDIENEFSDTQIIIEELKTSLISTEENYQNLTSGILHNTIQNGLVINSINETVNVLSQEVHYVISPKVEKIENKTEKNLEISLNSQTLLYAMKSELKEDYNNYANKVADMNIEAWKKNDIIDIKIETIEKGINQIKTEVQNGVRSLMLQIGKTGGKESLNNEKSLESLRKSLNLSMEKILSNQGLFLESCHRVQMDESQIESEISVMLEKLIDMLEKKMTTVMKDIKTLEKSVKNHDSRINRNILQANTNVVSLYEKNTKNNELVEHELERD
ncbi:uncharacterized protein LOC115876265 [Sitophilus oryzae]|uniref:Uncharacterized protein LOC115876265 n=1 Tax=Sitophilus oryzae TaxID=7048 RepID=A0A6J2XAH7_SITOR|nr:uncharacterized protein LOC115876265 [Sitophilus oryzae]